MEAVMNYGSYICLILAIVFGVTAFIFFLLKDKAAMLISGFSTLPKEERELYDKARLSKDQRNDILLWAFIMGIGSMLSLLSQFFAILAFGIWLVLFLKEVHFDAKKAFEEYKVK
jgi:hypothetical protein